MAVGVASTRVTVPAERAGALAQLLDYHNHRYYDLDEPEIPDAEFERQTTTNLLFDDPDGFSAKLEILRDAGVRNVVMWMGVGGVAQEHLLRSMRLFAEEVRPRFAR